MELSFLLLLAVLLALSNVHGFTQSGTLRQSSRHLVGFRAASSSKRSVIITGGNRGIGYECAARLLQSNICDYDIVLACRSIDLGEEAKSRMMKAAGTSGGSKVEVMELDLADLNSVSTFIKNWGNRPLDVLCLNAGIQVGKGVGVGSTTRERRISGGRSKDSS